SVWTRTAATSSPSSLAGSRGMGPGTFTKSPAQVNSNTCLDPPLGTMLAAPMRRFPLRLKIAGFAAGLVLLATGLVVLFTVIVPWRAKLKAQERLASSLVKTALPLGIDLRADGAHFDPARVHALVANSSRVQGVEIVYALLWDDKGNLDSTASSVNAQLLQKASEPLAQLYLRDRARALEVLVSARPPGIRRLRMKLAAGAPHSTIGRLDLGLSTI